MPEPKRQCQTCQYFQAAQLAGNGWCTHPARQMESDVKILVRERELACRNAWGNDLWCDPSLPATTSSKNTPPKITTLIGHRLDDEVTSVIDASAHGFATSMADDVVTFTTVRAAATPSRTANDVNAAAVADQDERARVMARGSRDAILSARKRHALRRSGPRAEALESDQSTDVETIPAAESVDLTPEVATSVQRETESAASEPAFTPDEVRSSVGLPRLRSFLRGEIDEQALAETGSYATRPSHFEHVMMRAEQIKQRTAAQQFPTLQIEAIEEFPHQAGLNDVPVVWDVDPGALDVGFSRLRPAIDSPNNLPVLTMDLADDHDVVTIEASPRTVLYQPHPIVVPPAMVSNDPKETPEENVNGVDLIDEVKHDPADTANDPQDVDHIAFESPRSSLWRSFNQRLRRRFKVQAETEPVPVFNEPFIDDELPYQGDDFAEIPEDTRTTAFQSHDPETWYDPDQPTRVQAKSDAMFAASNDGFVDDSADVDGQDAWIATTEESWYLDEREFPEPQPVEWHRTRHELLSGLPPVESLDDSVQFIAPVPEATPVVPLAPRRPLPDPRKFFDITEPSGLAAFRIALFGSSSRPIAEHASSLSRESSSFERAPQKERGGYSSTPSSSKAGPSEQFGGNWSNVNADERQRLDPVATRSSVESVHAQPRGSGTSRSHDGPRELPPRRVAPTKLITVPVEGGKSCATCRSFLPDGDGNRGRCTNEWASRHRSVVEADELACRSSFGDWWIAADSTWIPSDGDPSREDPAGRVWATPVRTRNID